MRDRGVFQIWPAHVDNRHQNRMNSTIRVRNLMNRKRFETKILCSRPGCRVNCKPSDKAVHSKRSLMVSDSIHFRWRSSTPLQSRHYTGDSRALKIELYIKYAKHIAINPPAQKPGYIFQFSIKHWEHKLGYLSGRINWTTYFILTNRYK